MSEELINIDPELWGPSFWNSMEAIACTLCLDNKKTLAFFLKTSELFCRVKNVKITLMNIVKNFQLTIIYKTH